MRRFLCVAVLLSASALQLSACAGGGVSAGRSAPGSAASALERHLRAGSQAALVRFELANARCVRAHGVPDFPDPTSRGVFPRARLRAIQRSTLAAKENTAIGTCAHLLSHVHGQLIGTRIRVSPRTLVRFSDCMRAHGLPGYPNLGLGKKVAATYAAYVRAHVRELRRATLACIGLLVHP